MIKAILMDFNGVIINDEPIQHAAYKEIFAAEGIEVNVEDYYSRLGMDDRKFVASLLEANGKVASIDKVHAMTRAKTESWRGVIDETMPIFPGVEDFVNRMANAFTLGIVSMARREEIDYVLEKTGMAPCFSIILSADDVTKCKPDPECYRSGFETIDAFRTSNGHLPMVHQDCVVIEDSPPGVLSARSADLNVVGVTNTVKAEDLRAAGAGAIAWNLDDWFPDSFRLVFA
jgi:HAD superfamily hydrolase (TIGR01509 family)